MSKFRRRLFTECLEARDVPNATLTGRTFEDANLDGFYTQAVPAYVGAPPAENAVAGVTVELDIGGDGTYEQTTTSDAFGEYRLTDVPDGNHKIRVSKAGFVSTTTSPNPIGVTNGVVDPLAQLTVLESPGEFQTPRSPSEPLNFGFVRTGGIASGTLFVDNDANGKPNGGDTGISRDFGNNFNDGARVSIFDAASKLVATARTNLAGNFAVGSLPDGTYTAVASSYADRGFVVNGPSTFTITGGKAVTGVNILLKPFAEITGTIFEDVNANTIYEQYLIAPGQETPLAGATVTLDLDNNGTIDRTTTSDASGKYTFTEVPDGVHTIATSRAGFTAIRKAFTNLVGGYQQPFPEALLPPPPAGYRLRVGVLPTDVNPFGNYGSSSLDIGLTRSAIVAIGAFVDLNKNGVQEFNEAGVPYATIQIDINSNGVAILSKTTDVNGNLVLTGIPDGTHKAIYNGQTRSFTVADGKTVTGVLFGVPSVLTGYTFEDADLNGFFTQFVLAYVGAPPGESGVSGVTVELDLGGDGTYEQTTTSNTFGEYSFTDVPDGSHKIRVSKAGFVSTTLSPLTITVSNGVVIIPRVPGDDLGPEVPGQQFQTPRTPSFPLNFGLVRAGGIASGTVYFDKNSDGKLSGTDTGISRDFGFGDGALVNIFDSASKLVATARTNLAGNFAVGSLPDGNYTAVASSYADRGFVVNGPSTFTITGGKAVTGVNIQVKSFGEITGTTFEDRDADGVFGQVVGLIVGGPAPEVILAGATVTLDLNSDGTIDRTTTSDANGKYTFNDVPDGTHIIATSRAGFTATRTASARFVSGFRQPEPIPQFAAPPEGYQPRVGVLPRASGFYPFFNDSLDLGLTKAAIVALGAYQDVNQNGVQEFDERGIANATIQIDFDSNGTIDLTKSTDANGNLVLTGIPNGTHTATYNGLPRSFSVADGKTVTGVVFGTPGGKNASFVVSTIGVAGRVRVLDSNGNPKFDLNPYPNAVGGTRAAMGDVNGDGIADIIIGVGPGASGPVLVFDGATQKQLFSLEAFEASFLGGVNVALADVTGDGKADAIITPDNGGGARVRVYDGATQKLIADFFGIDDVNFRGGAVASGADVNGDGVGDLIVAAGMGGGPRVAGWNGKSLVAGATPTRAFADFFAFESTLRNGVFLASGDVDGDGKADIIVGGGASGAPRVTVFGGNDLTATGKQTLLANFFAGDSNDRTGVRVSAKDIDGDGKADIITSSKSTMNAGTEVNAYLAKGISMSGPGETRFSVPPFADFQGGLYVG